MSEPNVLERIACSPEDRNESSPGNGWDELHIRFRLRWTLGARAPPQSDAWDFRPNVLERIACSPRETTRQWPPTSATGVRCKTSHAELHLLQVTVGTSFTFDSGALDHVLSLSGLANQTFPARGVDTSGETSGGPPSKSFTPPGRTAPHPRSSTSCPRVCEVPEPLHRRARGDNASTEAPTQVAMQSLFLTH